MKEGPIRGILTLAFMENSRWQKKTEHQNQSTSYGKAKYDVMSEEGRGL